MTKKNLTDRSFNSARHVPIKRTLSSPSELVDQLAERLYWGCHHHLSIERNQIRERELLSKMEANLNELMTIVEEFKTSIISPIYDFSKNMSIVESHFAEAKERTAYLKNMIVKPGRGNRELLPGYDDLALLIVAALTVVKGDRSLADRIGEIIAVNGPLHKSLNEDFPNQFVFEQFKFPSIYIAKGNCWERSSKTSLTNKARKYILATNPLSKTNKQERALVNLVLARGGYTNFEKMVERGETLNRERAKSLNRLKR
jgi:hypothetical protein